MPSTTRERLIDAALRLFAEKGYGAASNVEILKAADAQSGSFYYFFPTKQDLLLAVLDRYLAGIHAMLLEPAWAGVDDPIERVFALLAAYRRFLIETNFFFGCPIGNLALELHEPDPPVREKLAANFSNWKQAVQRCLEQAKDRFPPDPNTARLATFILTTMEGAVMQSRTYQSIEPFDASIACLRDYIDRLLR